MKKSQARKVVPIKAGQSTTPANKKNSVAEKWTPALAEQGHVPVVRAFLRNYSCLNPPLTSGEALFVVHLMDFKWGETAPFPSYRKIAGYMGISDKMARKHAQSLQLKKYLLREYKVGAPNRFDLQPLFQALEKVLKKSDR